MSKEIIKDLTTGSVPKRLLIFAVPFMISFLLQATYANVDMIIIGQFIGSEGLSSVAISAQVIWLVTALSMGFSVGAQIMIAQQVGSGKREELQKIIGTSSTTVFALAIIIMSAGLLLRDHGLSLLSTPLEAFAPAQDYLTITFLGFIFTFGYNLVSSILRGMGNSKHPLIFMAIAVCTNIILDFLFVAVFKWGVAGAAFATIFSQALSFVISVIYLYRHREAFGFDFRLKSFHIDFRRLKQLIRLGIPLALESGAISISMLFVNKFINQYGLVASATFGTGIRIEQIPWVIVNGLMMAGASMIGQNLGAGNTDRAKQTVHFSALISVASTIFFMLIFFFFPTEIYSLFTSDPAVLDMAPMFMFVLAITIPATSIMCPYMAFIQGIGNTELAFFIAILDGFFTRILLSLLLVNMFELGLLGWFLGYGLAAYVTLFLAAGYFYSGVWKNRKLLV